MSLNAEREVRSIRNIGDLNLPSKELGLLVKAFIEKGHGIQFKARGNSMLPFIKDGDNVTVVPCTDLTPKVGDIVAYIDRRTEKLIIHRIVGLHGNRFIAKGDGCFHRDPPQVLGNILGYISGIEYTLYGINVITARNFVTFFSQVGFWALFAKILIIFNKCKKIRRL